MIAKENSSGYLRFSLTIFQEYAQIMNLSTLVTKKCCYETKKRQNFPSTLTAFVVTKFVTRFSQILTSFKITIGYRSCLVTLSLS